MRALDWILSSKVRVMIVAVLGFLAVLVFSSDAGAIVTPEPITFSVCGPEKPRFKRNRQHKNWVEIRCPNRLDSEPANLTVQLSCEDINIRWKTETVTRNGKTSRETGYTISCRQDEPGA